MKKTTLVSIFILMVLLVLSSGLMAQTTYTVGTGGGYDYTTITDAIAAASNGDIIDVYGTITEEGITVDKGLTIQGQGQSSTIIQAHATAGSASDRVFEITSTEAVLIKDMTIRNGNSSQDGGGVYLHDGSTLDNCLLSWNSGRWGGGAFFFYGGSMINCIFSNNSSEDDGGGAYFEYGGTMDNCTFSDNIATENGGGVYFYNGGTMDNCTLNENSATGYGGGGVYFFNGGSMDNCTLNGNTTTGNGGGIYFETNGSINDCTLSDNTATGEGGSVYCYYGGILTNCFLNGNSADYGGGVYFNEGGIFNNCLLYENSADYGGGGAYFYYGGAMNNCTFSNNTTISYGGGAFIENEEYWYDESLLNNCILWDNTAVSNGNDIYIAIDGIVLYTCASDGLADGVDNCIISNPLWLDAGNNDYHLSDLSPCIGSGSTTYAPVTDIEGILRGDPPDMGAYENNLDAPLPVNLSSFYALYIGGTPTLYWTTQSEIENAYWNVYRGNNDNFEEAALLNANNPVPGNGTTTTPSDYIYIDTAPVIQNTTYWYWVEDVSFDGETEVHEPITLEIPFEDTPITPDTYGLHQNYPNPFNPSTSISFTLSDESNVELIIYNIKGEKVKQLVSKQLSAGQHSVIWDGDDIAGKKVSSGIYLYKLFTDIKVYQRKMLLVK